jgi:hypothetical protein
MNDRRSITIPAFSVLLRFGLGFLVALSLFAQLNIQNASLPPATLGQSYSSLLAATGGTPPYQWATTGLPGGLTLNSTTGLLSGTPSAVGVFNFTVQVTDAKLASATGSFSLTINPAALSITTAPPLFAGTVGIPYSQPFSAAGGTPPYTWSILSGDTGGLTLDASTGTLHGTPQTAGTFTFVVKVADSVGAIASQSFSVVVNAPVLSIAVSSALPPGAVGIAYNQSLSATAVGGTPPYQWSVIGGGLVGGGPPAPGLTFSANALTISGTPSIQGTFTFILRVTDSNGQTASKSLSITIAPPGLSITTNSQLPDGSLNAAYTATLAAQGGAPPYTWSAVGLPNGLSINSSSGAITGVPAAAGSFAIAITVTDTTLASFSNRFTLNINLPATPAASISGLPATAAAAQQYPIQVTLASIFPATITGQAILTFSPDTGPTDQTVQFASGGTTASFSIPAGTTTAISSVPLALQTGTTAGTISVSLRLQAGGIDITPVPAPALSTQIAAAAPVITHVQTMTTAGSISIMVSGYSTAREVLQATFALAAASGQTLQSSASSIVVSVQSLFSAWFQNPSNSPYGTQFVLTQPFNVQGDASAVIPRSITLSNSFGSTTYGIQ